MKKLKEIKRAIANTSPDRLAKIEFQSHLMQMVGVSIVCGIFIWQGYWWIILAFIFSLGISFSQMISAYQRYQGIMAITGETYDYDNDKSPTRKRDYVIKESIGWSGKAASFLISIGLSLYYVPHDTWYFKILFSFSILAIYLLVYFFPIYWYSKFLFKRGVKSD